MYLENFEKFIAICGAVLNSASSSSSTSSDPLIFCLSLSSSAVYDNALSLISSRLWQNNRHRCRTFPTNY